MTSSLWSVEESDDVKEVLVHRVQIDGRHVEVRVLNDKVNHVHLMKFVKVSNVSYGDLHAISLIMSKLGFKIDYSHDERALYLYPGANSVSFRSVESLSSYVSMMVDLLRQCIRFADDVESVLDAVLTALEKGYVVDYDLSSGRIVCIRKTLNINNSALLVFEVRMPRTLEVDYMLIKAEVITSRVDLMSSLSRCLTEHGFTAASKDAEAEAIEFEKRVLSIGVMSVLIESVEDIVNKIADKCINVQTRYAELS